MFRHLFGIGIVGLLPVTACVLWPVPTLKAGDEKNVDPERQLVFKVKGLT